VFLADDPFYDVTCHGAMVLLLFFIFDFGGFVQLFTRVTSNGQGVGPYGWDQEHSNMFPAFVLRFVIFFSACSSFHMLTPSKCPSETLISRAPVSSQRKWWSRFGAGNVVYHHHHHQLLQVRNWSVLVGLFILMGWLAGLWN
jgi:fatty acid desaturase